MRRIYNLLFVLFSVCVIAGAASCSDDDPQVGGAEDLVGRWTLLHIKGYVKVDEQVHIGIDEGVEKGTESEYYIDVREDGSFRIQAGEQYREGEWALSDKTLKLDIFENDTYNVYFMDFTVRELTQTTLDISYSDLYSYYGSCYEEYVRIRARRQ